MFDVTLKRRVDDLSSLLDLAKILAAQTDLDRLLDIITRAAWKHLRCERATLWLYDDEHQELYTRITTQLEVDEIRIPLSKGIAGHVARTRQIANIDDPKSDAHHDSSIDRTTGFVTRNILAGPLVNVVENKLVGVLQLLNKTDGSFDAYDEYLLEAFGSHAAIALGRAQLLDAYHKKKEIEVSLAIARDIQAELFPDTLPQIRGYESAGWSRPCDATGGDYYDAFDLGPDTIGLTVADVSGHGLGPSLLMASTRATLHGLLTGTHDPLDVVTKLDRILSHDLASGKFVTLIYAVLDAARHRLAYCSAGHGPVLHYRAASGVFHSLPSTGVPLGVFPDLGYEPGEPVQLEPGDLVLFATDGIVETVNPAQEQYGPERLQRLLARAADQSPAQIIEQVRQAVDEFRVRTPQADDLTLLLLKRLPT